MGLFGFFAVFGIVILFSGLLLFLVDTYNHMKWLKEQEKYWDNVKKSREEKERAKARIKSGNP